jgi:xanthine/uracil permease
VDVPKLVAMVDAAKGAALAASATGCPSAGAQAGRADADGQQPNYGALDNMAMAGVVLVSILLLVRYGKGFVANISVLLGIVIGCVVAVAMGKMNFDKVAKAHWFDVVTPFAFGMPTFDRRDDPDHDAGDDRGDDRIHRHVPGAVGHDRASASARPTGRAGLRTDGLGTLIGGIFNTFPYTSFSQNVGLVGVTGVKSRWVCVAGGVIMIVLGLLPKMARWSNPCPPSCWAAPGW